MERLVLKRLVDGYRPHQDTLAKLNNLHLVLLVGPSGVGKSALMEASGWPEVIGDASRAPRAGERNGVDYWFRSEDEMVRDMEAGRYLQVAIGSEGDIKATHPNNFPSEGTAVFAVVASAVPLFRALPFAGTTTAVVVPPDFDTWMIRLQDHRLSRVQLEPRLAEARKSYEFALQDGQVKFILNDDLEAAVRRLHQAVKGVEPDDAETARTVAADLLRHLAT